MQLNIGNDIALRAHEASMRELEAELVRLSGIVNIDIDTLDPATFVPDPEDFNYKHSPRSYEIFVSTLNKYKAISAKVQELKRDN